ncbi:undecaprenyl-diphosphate phosphatase [Haliea sp. E17]|uniref:undecaprenyl-diphosphate phosphatase n=1 Tax=Haliea sp. E17 TaxID=3401576 RepID=UPI003AACBA29
MDLMQAFVLAVLQGLTEFLPISSSAHLVIPSLVLGWDDQGLAFDVAVHVGTLSAVVIYYSRDLWKMACAWLGSLAGRGSCEDSILVWKLAVATIPAIAVGLFLGDAIEGHARNLPVIATTTLVFGLLLGMADRYAIRVPGDAAIGWRQALLIGAAQALALVPGVSRSGVTITAGLFLNLSRQDAARFSFLLSIPVIAGAGLLKAMELAESGQPVDWTLLGLAALVSGITAFSCITVFLRLLDRVGMMPFVYYRIVLAGVLYAMWLV